MVDQKNMFNVRDYGAMGDDSHIDTSAVQAAIDKCNLAGGGTVFVPSGVYRCGTIYLRNNICLYLDAGAVVMAEPTAQWNASDCFPENFISEKEKSDGRHLVIAYKLKNTSIAGHGFIDGNYKDFHGDLNKNGRLTINGTRPSQMIFFCDCEHVSVRDVHLINSSQWTLFIYGCRNVQIDGVYAKTEPEVWCGDGIDIDSSQNVCVSNCIIDAEDDAITLRCDNKRLKSPCACENITVTNCVLKSLHANAIRVGVGDGTIKNVLFNNIIAKEGISVCGRYLPSHDGTAAENIVFSNFNIESKGAAFFVSCGYHSNRKCSNILFSGMHVRAGGCSYVGGMPDNITEAIVFKDVSITLVEGRQNNPEKVDLIDEIWGKSHVYCKNSADAPFAFWIEHARNCRFKDCSIALEDQEDVWLEAVRMINVENIDTNSLKLEGFADTLDTHSKQGDYCRK